MKIRENGKIFLCALIFGAKAVGTSKLQSKPHFRTIFRKKRKIPAAIWTQSVSAKATG